MLPNTFRRFIRHLSKTSTNTAATPTVTATSIAWRTQFHHRLLISQISSILLQRHNWPPLLQTFRLTRNLNPSLFFQILNKIQTNPQISLDFFHWVKSSLGFHPGLKSHLKIIQILIASGNTKPVKSILDSIIQVNPSAVIIDNLIQLCRGTDSESRTFDLLLDFYAKKSLYSESLEVYRKSIVNGYVPEISCCNALLGALERASEFKLGWCLYGSMIRNGIVENSTTWSIIARIICKDGKLERAVRLLSSGLCNSVIYDLVIDGYSKRGNLGAALHYLNELCDKQLEPGFAIYVSVLDGACESGNTKMIEMVMDRMMDKKLIPESRISNYDVIIKKFCELEKPYAAQMVLKQALEDDKACLKKATFGYMLTAFSRKVRVKEAVKIYRLVEQKGVAVSHSSYRTFAENLCLSGDSSEDVLQLLVELMKRGVKPTGSALSEFMTLLIRKDRWKDLEDLVNVILEQGLVPDSSSCGSLVKHFCSCGRVDNALELHEKLEKLDVVLDVKVYNELLRRLFAEKRIDEAMKMFDCMRMKNVVSSASFLVMISGLSSEKEMRKAMQVHDEMLKRGLKPRAKNTYKSLISVFR